MSIFQFLNLLDEKRIIYRLERVRDSLMVEIAVPGERWEVEFFEDGRIETERFVTTAEILGEESLAELFEKLGE
ncbi:MAG: hypothetical protein E7651_01850 [Ruminococcaceae bacterium]|nr:hypothetical protein [Oscillospiraceae bacterium]